MSYRKREVALQAPLGEVVHACKQVAAAAGWRLAHESPRRLYFHEPIFSLRRFRRFESRLELTVALRPERTGARALVECERLGALQALNVERDLAMFVHRLFSSLGEQSDAPELGGRSLVESRRGRTLAARLHRLRAGQVSVLGLCLVLMILAVVARVGGATPAAKALVVAGLWVGLLPPRYLEILRLRAVGSAVRREIVNFWLPLVVGALLTWFLVTR